MKRPLAWWLIPIALISASCSVPNLESPECSAARDVVSQYYSLAIGGDPMSNPTVLVKLKALRSADFVVTPAHPDGDEYHFSSQQPTSFRVGECIQEGDRAIKARVKVIWRINDQNAERDDIVTLVKLNDAWLISRVETGPEDTSNS